MCGVVTWVVKDRVRRRRDSLLKRVDGVRGGGEGGGGGGEERGLEDFEGGGGVEEEEEEEGAVRSLREERR